MFSSKMSHSYIMNQIVLEFIPILLLFLLVSYTDIIVNFSHTILGKLVAVIIIILYTMIDIIHGLVVCLIFIFYYQTDYVENMLNREGLTNSDDSSDDNTAITPKATTSPPTTAVPKSITATPTTAAPKSTTSAPTTSAPTTSAPTTSAPTISAPTTSAPTTSAPTTSVSKATTSAPTTSVSKTTTSSPTTSAPTTSAHTTSAPTTSASKATTAPSNDKESFELLEDAYRKEPEFNKNHEASKQLFKKQYCNKGHLIYKGQVVNREMSEHIFPEIKLNNERCNICDPTCDFSIKDKQIHVEENLVKPKNSNDLYDYVMKIFIPEKV